MGEDQPPRGCVWPQNVQLLQASLPSGKVRAGGVMGYIIPGIVSRTLPLLGEHRGPPITLLQVVVIIHSGPRLVQYEGCYLIAESSNVR